MADYELGVVVRVAWVIQSLGVDADPTAMTFKYQYGLAGPVTTLVMGTDAALVKDATGHYHVDLTTAQTGDLYYRVDATGTNAVSAQNRMSVKESYF